MKDRDERQPLAGLVGRAGEMPTTDCGPAPVVTV
jgi:hypothetical protein